MGKHPRSRDSQGGLAVPLFVGSSFVVVFPVPFLAELSRGRVWGACRGSFGRRSPVPGEPPGPAHPACDATGRLEERKRLVTTFYFYEGLTLKEIGRALNLTEGCVSQILKHALTRLRKITEESSSLA